ncbi:MAG: DUF4476 domain-containing protein, partial [Cryomorphaceae bacterium]
VLYNPLRMKAILRIPILLFGLLPLLGLAQETSNLVIFSENGESFTVSIDGDKKNEVAQSNVRVEGLKGDFHKISVQFEDEELGSVSQNFILEPGTEQKAQVMMKKNGKWVIRPFGESIFIKHAAELAPEPTPSRERVVYEQESAPVEEVTTITTTTSPGSAGTSGESVDMQIGVSGESIGVSVRVNDGMSQSSTTTTVTETRSVSKSVADEPMERAVIVDDCAPMTTSDFQSALQSLKSKTFSDSRMTQAKQVLKANCMSADQIKTVMSAFEYEDDKLEFAKIAHDQCTDPENYWKVNDAFEFEMTIDELNDYIESK